MTQIPTTDTRALSAFIEGRPYRQSLPGALPDEWIRPLTRDLRQLQEPEPHHDDHKRLAAAMLVAIHALRGRMLERAGQPMAESQPEFIVSEDQMFQAFRVWQIFLEREIVTRALGLSSEGDEAAFIRAVDQVIQSEEQADPRSDPGGSLYALTASGKKPKRNGRA